MITEAQIIEGCKQRNPVAQEEFYKSFGPRMKMICMRYVKSTFEAEDLFHETLVKIFNKITSYTGQGSFAGWVKAITVHAAIDYYHKENKLKVSSSNIEESIDGADQVEESDLFEKIASEVTLQELLDLVHQLPQGYKMVFNLYAIENYSHQQVSDMLGISVGTSKSQLCKARRYLKDIIISKYLILDERKLSR